MIARPRRLAVTQDRWMVSYVDVLTILLIFFVAASANKFKAPLAVKVRPPTPPVRLPLAELEERLAKENLSLKLEARGLTISLPQAILFSPGDDRIQTAALTTLEKIADAIRPISNRVNLSGYADSTPIHSSRFRGNWDLAAARSLRLMEVLTKKFDLEESRFSVSSYGSNDPRGSNGTADGRASNRRVEILVMP